jgi:repressor of nif and glnA expression
MAQEILHRSSRKREGDERVAGMNKIMFAILSVIERHQVPVHSPLIVSSLVAQGMDISERTARYYLKILDERGFTANSSNRGRTITEKGLSELRQGFAYDRVGFIIDRINRLSLETDFDPDTGAGKVILNVSYVKRDRVGEALQILSAVCSSPYALSERIVLAHGGGRLNDIEVPEGLVGIGTVCSITINGIFLRAGIPIRPRVGGIVEIARRKPVRFQSFISYEHSSVAPLEIFIKSRMTKVLNSLDTGDGTILGSFREIPQDSLFASRRLAGKLMTCGFRNTTLYGFAFKPLLGIAVTDGMVGLVDIGGLNPAAALAESGLSLSMNAMATMYEYAEMKPMGHYLRSAVSGRSPDSGLLEQRI